MPFNSSDFVERSYFIVSLISKRASGVLIAHEKYAGARSKVDKCSAQVGLSWRCALPPWRPRWGGRSRRRSSQRLRFDRNTARAAACQSPSSGFYGADTY